MDGAPVSVGGAKRAEALAFLALHAEEVVRVETLAEALWDAGRPSDVRNAVQHHVARLRKALPPACLTSLPDGYAARGLLVDAMAFGDRLTTARAALRSADLRTAYEAAEQALSLWRGPALLGLRDGPWGADEAVRLDALRVDALETRSEAALALGDHFRVLPDLRTAVQQHPFRERLWGQLMLALYRSGRQADALEAFQEARRRLSQELGLEPGPDLRRLQQTILNHDVAIARGASCGERGSTLPATMTSFVGRRAELLQARELLGRRRLVTLVGPPGTGKTRLALELARSLEPEIDDGVWLADLARVGTSDGVARVIADAVDPASAGRDKDGIAPIVSRLRNLDGVLMIDGCERLVEEVARVIAAVVAECPCVRVVATSRQALRAPGEARLWVGPLPTGPVEETDPIELRGSEAVQLFAERACDARPEFTLTSATRPIVARICRRLEGLPRAIELAAAHTGVLGLGELLRALDRELAGVVQGPTPGGRGISSLGTLVAWSYDLLPQDEQTVLRHLAVFEGGCSLPAATAIAAVAGLGEDAPPLLRLLVDKSILRVSFPHGEARYELLETVRRYARARLVESGGLRKAGKAHGEFFAQVAREAGPALRGPEHLRARRRLGLDRGNLWAALRYARDSRDGELAVTLAAGVGWYFVASNRFAEGRRFLELALSVGDGEMADGRHVTAVELLCHLTNQDGDPAGAVTVGERGLALAGLVDTERETARLQAALALALLNADCPERGALLLGQAHATAVAIGDEWCLGGCELIEATLALRQGDLEAADAHGRLVLEHARRTGYRTFEVWARTLEGNVAERRRESARACSAYYEALRLARDLDLPECESFALAHAGAAAEGKPEQAETLQRDAVAVAEGAGLPWFAEHARRQLARTLEREKRAQRAHGSPLPPRSARAGRETFFAALAGEDEPAARPKPLLAATER